MIKQKLQGENSLGQIEDNPSFEANQKLRIKKIAIFIMENKKDIYFGGCFFISNFKENDLYGLAFKTI